MSKRKRRFLLPTLALGLAVMSQANADNKSETVVSTRCALAIFSALRELAQEPFIRNLETDLQGYLGENYREVTCRLDGDEAEIVLTRANATRGGDIYYRVGLESLNIMERRFER